MAACCLLLALPRVALARENAAYRATPEWVRVVTVWHVVLDHSQGTIYSLDRFKEAAPGLDRADKDLHALAARGLLSRDLAEGLVWVLRTRYSYVRDHCYVTTSQVTRDEVEAARGASMWVMEMQLAMLRQQPLSEQLDVKLREAIRANLVTELTFQRSLVALGDTPRVKEPPADRGPAAGQAEPKRDEAAQAKRLQESLRRQRQLLIAYRDGKLPRDRTAQRLAPYVMELTQTPPERDMPAAPPSSLP